jgi:Leucine-rich repeat (LRR) protein
MAQRVQRYALATFYYSTFMVEHEFLSTPTDWSSSENWISDLDECTWEGISCNINKQVISITLEEHALSGSLPVELAFLTALQELDFTSNFIYMEDNLNDVWLHLNQLKVLLMEDNYVVTSEGLPTQFSGLTSLQKLILSYNLLQGTLQPESFMSMSSLQHLEIESNYLSGDIPSTLGKLSNLVYIYARRNIFDFALSDMITPASYPALFSLWLDNNPIRGRIPATIADLKNLASLSITNATLTGPIPTELGMLTGLRRVWLYANSLSGSVPTQLNALTKLEVLEIQENNLIGVMPPNVCQTVQASPYEFRALTADCDSVSCDCCTVCY